MSRRRNRGDEPTLFDLPLDAPQESAESPEPAAPPESERSEQPDRSGASDASRPESAAADDRGRLRLPLEETPAADPAGRPRPAAPTEQVPTKPWPAPVSEPRPPAEPGTASLSVRWLAGLADLAVHLALAIALLFGARLLGVRAGLGDWPPIGIFLLVFSFFYSVLPLAFWGQTPGMAWAGVAARAPFGESLTFPQTALRWLGGLLTVALLGLPILLAAGGRRSLSDRLSDSDTILVD